LKLLSYFLSVEEQADACDPAEQSNDQPPSLLLGYKSDHHSSKECMTLALPVLLLLANLGLTQTSSPPNTQSPAIHSLEQQVASGQTAAVDEFWSRIANQHSPIVEVDPVDPSYSFVTFVWRGSSDTRNVVVISPMALVNFEDAVMERVAETNVWFKTYRMRNDARMSYRFAVNDSPVTCWIGSARTSTPDFPVKLFWCGV
jgi:hypothetical protein